MANDITKSLLNRSQSPGSTFGELAGMYLSGGRKKDNRARNLLLASLFFNAAEASRQAKVKDKLQKQELENKMLESKLASQFETQMNLINKDQEIKRRGKYDYFDADAELAFEQAVDNGKLEKMFGAEGGLKEGDAIKRKWKKQWIDQNSFADHSAQMVNIDVKTAPRTLEAFSKEAKEYMYAVNKNITKPQDISLVHKAFGTIGIGKSDKEYNEEVIKTKRALDEQQARVEQFYKYDIEDNISPKDISLDISNKEVTQEYAASQFDTLGINDEVLKRQFLKDVATDGMTLKAVNTNLSTYVLQSQEKQLEARDNEAKLATYKYFNVSDQAELDKKIQNKEISQARVNSVLQVKRMESLGVKDDVATNINLAEDWVATLTKAQGLSDEKAEELKSNYFDNVINAQFTRFDEKQLQQAAESVYKYSLTQISKDIDLYKVGDDLMLANINSMQLNAEQIAALNSELREQGDKGNEVIKQLKEANYQLDKSILKEDSPAYNVLETELAETYFSWRRKQAAVILNEFDRVGSKSIVRTTTLQETVNPPRLNDSLNLNIQSNKTSDRNK